MQHVIAAFLLGFPALFSIVNPVSAALTGLTIENSAGKPSRKALMASCIGGSGRAAEWVPAPRGHDRLGRLSAQGWIASNAAAACNTPRSSRRRPTICRPTGRPSAVKPQGTLAAGFQDMLNG